MVKQLMTLIAALTLCTVSKSQSIPKMKMADVVATFSKDNDTVYVVNFWATFCKPCVGEIPDFIRITKKYAGQKVKLLLVSLDLKSYYPNRIAAFVKQRKFNTNIAWLDETNADIFCPMIDKKWSGAIPATIIINNRTGYRKFFEDEIKAVQFEKEIRDAIWNSKADFFPKFNAPMNDVIRTKFTDSLYQNASATFLSKDSTVFSVADGKVARVVKVEDFLVVMIEMGNNFYTYSNLKKVLVKTGDMVRRDQPIAFADLDRQEKIPSLDFYFSTGYKTVYLSKENFITRDNKRKFDHSIEPQLNEPQ